ncbi:hypothetical protein [Photobacterium damselae]|uniref:hypothetical protein n=1 Tax=Photobacterium damselae TaxID=38293 RepID=UPI0015A0668D|nr:hypothetical protein [Photobacterium damselae]NVO59511.1 hypothetical protein [Photobacterium damselae subsp. damselae]
MSEETTILNEEQEAPQEPSSEALARFQLYCTTLLELDKSILTLSTAGLGFAATYLMSDKLSSYPIFILLSLGALCFAACAGTILTVLHKNAGYIAKPPPETEAEYEELERDEAKLKRLDIFAKSSFVLALIFTVLAAFTISLTQLQAKLDTGPITQEVSTNEQQPEQSAKTKQFSGSGYSSDREQLSGCKDDPQTSQSAKNIPERQRKEIEETINGSEQPTGQGSKHTFSQGQLDRSSSDPKTSSTQESTKAGQQEVIEVNDESTSS